jgi:hypothetical protein
MAAIVLPKGSILKFDGTDISEHNRGEITVDIMRFENSKRMHNATLRKNVLADKLKWNISWELLPDQDAKTVDGKWGAASLETFYRNTPGVFVLTVKNSGTPVNYNAVITSFSKTIVKRGAYEAWNIDLTIEEA